MEREMEGEMERENEDERDTAHTSTAISRPVCQLRQFTQKATNSGHYREGTANTHTHTQTNRHQHTQTHTDTHTHTHTHTHTQASHGCTHHTHRKALKAGRHVNTEACVCLSAMCVLSGTPST